MVCNRCIMVMQQELNYFNIKYKSVELGKIELENELNLQEYEKLQIRLKEIGFEIINSKNDKIIEDIKNFIISFVNNENHNKKVLFSNMLSNYLNVNYNSLSKLFSKVENKTIEQYLIECKINRVKELLRINEKSQKEIAFELDYSSTSHLSTQFKHHTGLTPTQYKKEIKIM